LKIDLADLDSDGLFLPERRKPKYLFFIFGKGALEHKRRRLLAAKIDQPAGSE
jgi:hypothetical protein